MPSISKHFLVLSISILSLTGCSHYYKPVCFSEPSLTSINIVDRNGLTETINNPERLEQYAQVNFLQPQPYQKVLRIYLRDCQGNIPSCITSYHPNGYPSKFLEVMNSRACGEYKEWYPNGILKVSAHVIEGTADIANGCERTWLFDECSQAWDECGNLAASITYVKGDLQGLSLYYHPNGNIWKSIPYVKNLVQGTVELFMCDGTLLETSSYCGGLRDGKTIRYWTPDQMAAEEDYCEGLLSHGEYFDTCGESIAQIDNGLGTRVVFGKDVVVELQAHKNGIIEGEVQQLDKYGRVCSLYHAKKGSKHGEEIYYYDAPRFKQTLIPKLSILWFEGKIQGIVKTWYEDGAQESQREVSNNKKNGHSTAWYRDGSLMLIEEYEQDLLMRGEYYNKGERFSISTIDEGKGTATLFNSDGTLIRKIEYKNGKPILDD